MSCGDYRSGFSLLTFSHLKIGYTQNWFIQKLTYVNQLGVSKQTDFFSHSETSETKLMGGLVSKLQLNHLS